MYYGNEVELIYTIIKTKVQDTITVYDYNVFLQYINNLSVTAIFSVLQNNLGNRLFVEIWGEQYERFNTCNIAFFKRGDSQPELVSNRDRTKRKEKCEESCQWNAAFTNLSPEDLHITYRENDNRLSQLFDQLSILLSACYVSDFSSLDQNGITLRLSGYKMMIVESQVTKAKDLHFDKDATALWFNIYDWCYTGGYTSDRLCIARNIISLNCSNIEELKLNASTLDAIKSNFKIFEKDNVRQYIKVRNDISQILLDMQGKVNSMVEGFIGDFHKSVISLGTFFLTVIVIRVISKGDITGAFSGQILLLSLAFIVLSAVNLYYSRKVLKRKERLFNKHYDQLKDRYRHLLSNEESIQIFEDCDPRKYETHANYILWQEKVYTRIWRRSLIGFSVLLIGMWGYNNIELSEAINTITKCIHWFTNFLGALMNSLT